MSTDPHNRVYSDLVASLLDARSDPVTERFDADLEQAVQRGDLSALTARRLRFWQRASLRALTDHTRYVLPTVLAALEASRREGRKDIDALLAAIDDTAQDGPDEPERAAATAAETATTAGPEVVDLRDTPGPTSTPGTSGPSSLGEVRRLLVAGLMTATPVIRPEHG